MIEQHVGTFMVIALSLAICAFVYAASIVQEWLLRGVRITTMMTDASRLIRLAALVIVSIAVARFSVDVVRLTQQSHTSLTYAAYESLQLLWYRLSIALVVCAVLSWVFVIIESAVTRRTSSPSP